jgi:hypothetical protein
MFKHYDAYVNNARKVLSGVGKLMSLMSSNNTGSASRLALSISADITMCLKGKTHQRAGK